MSNYRFERESETVAIMDATEGLSYYESSIGNCTLYPIEGQWFFKARDNRNLSIEELTVITSEIKRLNSEI